MTEVPGSGVATEKKQGLKASTAGIVLLSIVGGWAMVASYHPGAADVVAADTSTVTDPNSGAIYDTSVGFNDPTALAAAIKIQANRMATAEGQPLIADIFCVGSSDRTFDCHATSDQGVAVNFSFVVAEDGQSYVPKAGQ